MAPQPTTIPTIAVVVNPGLADEPDADEGLLPAPAARTLDGDGVTAGALADADGDAGNDTNTIGDSLAGMAEGDGDGCGTADSETVGVIDGLRDEPLLGVRDSDSDREEDLDLGGDLVRVRDGVFVASFRGALMEEGSCCNEANSAVTDSLKPSAGRDTKISTVSSSLGTPSLGGNTVSV
jgi:hypothetical protein